MASLCRNSRVGPPQVDRDRPRRGVGLDALRQVAAPRAARVGADDAVVERRVWPARRTTRSIDARKSSGRTGAAVGEPQPAAQLERVRAPTVSRLRDARGEVGDERAAAGARDATVGDEAVVGQRQHRPVCTVVAGRVDAVADRTAADSKRSVPPRWLARDTVVAAHTEPPATASADGALPTAMRRVSRACRADRCGSRRRLPASATQIAPGPAATATGLPPTRTVSLTAFVAASIRVTVPSSRLATQMPP